MRRTSGRSARALTLNVGVRYDLQFLKTIATDTQQRLAARRLCLVAVRFAPDGGARQLRTLLRPRSAARRWRTRCCRSNNTTDAHQHQPVQREPFAHADRRAGISRTSCPAPACRGRAGQLQHHGSEHAKCLLRAGQPGDRAADRRTSTFSVGYQHLRGLHLIISVNQNVPTCVASGNNNGCRPNPNYANNSQYSSLADSHYDGLHVSFVQRPVKWGSFRVSYTCSKSLDNVGEFFFSSPINLVQHLAGLRPQRRRSAASRGGGWRHTSLAGAGQERLAAHQPWLRTERDAAVLLGAAAEHHLRRHHDPGHRRPARS